MFYIFGYFFDKYLIILNTLITHYLKLKQISYGISISPYANKVINTPLTQFEKITNEIICPFDIIGFIIGLSNYTEAILTLNGFHLIWQFAIFFVIRYSYNSQFILIIENNFFAKLLGVNNFFLMYVTAANFICLINSSGLSPYAKTLTAQITVTFVFAFILLITVWWLAVIKKKSNVLNLFWPKGVPLEIASQITAIESFSFGSRIISLTTRLFANITAGHSLLKILAGFFKFIFKQPKISLIYCGTLLWILVFSVTLLEVIISILQGYVFVTLFLIFIDEICIIYISKSAEKKLAAVNSASVTS